MINPECLSKWTFLAYALVSVYMVTFILDVEDFFGQYMFDPTDLREYLCVGLGYWLSGCLLGLISRHLGRFIQARLVSSSVYMEPEPVYLARVQCMLRNAIVHGCAAAFNWCLLYFHRPEYLPRFFGGKLRLVAFLDYWPQEVRLPLRVLVLLSAGKSSRVFCPLTARRQVQTARG